LKEKGDNMMLMRTTNTINEVQHPENVTDVTHYNNYDRPPILLYQEPTSFHNMTNQFPWLKMSLVMSLVISAIMLLAFFGTSLWVDNPTQVEWQQEQKQEQELQHLFAQPRIDPLTDAINGHEGDNTRMLYVQRLKTERAKRCSEIERRFQIQPKNNRTLAKLTKGYNYSCPDVITRFAQRI
jgi:hypothetical protein